MERRAVVQAFVEGDDAETGRYIQKGLAGEGHVADLVDNGIALAGGGALLRGMDTVLSNATGLDVTIADDPLTCVARGTAVYLENLEDWKATMESDEDEF